MKIALADVPFGVSRNGGGWRLIKDANDHVAPDYGRHVVAARTSRAMDERRVDQLSRSYRRGLR